MLFCAAAALAQSPATQPAIQPVFLVFKLGSTYHVAGCKALPAEGVVEATPEDLQNRKPCPHCISDAIRAAIPTATQPALTGLPKYYNLLKNEFMKDEDGTIILTPAELQDAIRRLRANASQEKAAIDREIAALTGQIQAAEGDRRQAIKDARESKADARQHDALANKYYVYRGSSNIYVDTWRHSYHDAVADRARDRTQRQKQDAAHSASLHPLLRPSPPLGREYPWECSQRTTAGTDDPLLSARPAFCRLRTVRCRCPWQLHASSF